MVSEETFLHAVSTRSKYPCTRARTRKQTTAFVGDHGYMSFRPMPFQPLQFQACACNLISTSLSYLVFYHDK